ncbi:hypothetical protein F5884DRAFT_779443 [Xylogone sp. PMI_703]|nr:hypothetical protein F5884DRAFT_779443 [Xylogone sp. PMI_703]
MKSFLAVAIFVGICQAVFVAPSHANNGGCAGAAQDIDISVGAAFNLGSPQTCVFNTDKDNGFNMLVCSGFDETGECAQLSDFNRVDIDGFFNWQIPFGFNSIQRNGN